jgi:hypothetical protein
LAAAKNQVTVRKIRPSEMFLSGKHQCEENFLQAISLRFEARKARINDHIAKHAVTAERTTALCSICGMFSGRTRM